MNRMNKQCRPNVLLAVSVASMIDQFNLPNIRLLRELGYTVHVACNFRQGNTCDAKRVRRLKHVLDQMEVVSHQWDCPRDLSSIFDCSRAFSQLWDLTGRYRFAWMHCQSPIGGALARAAAHGRGIRVVYTAHGFHFYKGAPFKNWLLYYPVEKLLSYWTDMLVTVNREDYRLAVRRFSKAKICYTPGIGIDTARFYGVPPKRDLFCKKFAIPKDAPLLLSVGELNKGKNHKMVLDALAAIRRSNVYYMVCGQGEQYGALMEHAKKLGIMGRVRLVGYQEDMPWIYRNADLFVFPSVREGMPVALLEAMAAGLACAASDIRGNRELIGPPGAGEKAGGMLFAPGSVCQLAAVLLRLLDHCAFRNACGKYNRKKALYYSRAVVEKQMRGIYKEMGSCVDYG